MRAAVAPGDIALTFDDGPNPIWTERLLDALESRRARATFFVQGPAVEKSPHVIERILGGGHEVGLHCFRHVRHSTMAAPEIRGDVEAALATLERLGVRPTRWRTPWGDQGRMTSAIAEEFGLELWGWSRDTHDWRGDSGQLMLEAQIAAGLGGGDVVLMHDGIGPGARRVGCEETVWLTDALLDLAEEKELNALTLTASLSPSRP